MCHQNSGTAQSSVFSKPSQQDTHVQLIGETVQQYDDGSADSNPETAVHAYGQGVLLGPLHHALLMGAAADPLKTTQQHISM